MTALASTATETTGTLRFLREVAVADTSTPATVAACCGCDEAAVVELRAFVIDGSFATLLAPTVASIGSADVLGATRASTVRQLTAPEVLLALSIDRGHPTYMARSLERHDALAFCLRPPAVYAIIAPESLRGAFGAALLDIADR